MHVLVVSIRRLIPCCPFNCICHFKIKTRTKTQKLMRVSRLTEMISHVAPHHFQSRVHKSIMTPINL
jgi:hypothetical protein